MPVFEFKSPDGKIHEITGPDGSTPEQAWGMLQSQLNAAPQEKEAPSNSLSGSAKSIGYGLALDGVAGLMDVPGMVANLGVRGIKAGADALGFKTADAPKQPYSITDAVKGVIGDYEPQTGTEQVLRGVASFVPSAMMGPGGIARRLAFGAVAPGLASEGAGELAAGTGAEPVAKAAAALVAPGAARRLLTPLPAAERAHAAGVLAREGIEIPASSRSGSGALGYVEDTLGNAPFAGSQATRIRERGQQQLTDAAFARMGMPRNVPKTPQNVEGAVQGLSHEIETVANRNVVNLDNHLVADIYAARGRYDRKLQSQQRAIVDDVIEDIAGFQQRGGVMPGQYYQQTRSDLSRMAKGSERSDPLYAATLRDIRQGLDNAMARSVSPADAHQWRDALNRWGHWKTLESALKGQTPAGTWTLTPAALQQAILTRNKRGAIAGRGDMTEMATAAARMMRPLPQSGTAPRNFALGMAGAGGWLGGLPGAAIGAAGPALIGRTLMSRPVQGYLSNQRFMPQGQENLSLQGLARMLQGAQ